MSRPFTHLGLLPAILTLSLAAGCGGDKGEASQETGSVDTATSDTSTSTSTTDTSGVETGETGEEPSLFAVSVNPGSMRVDVGVSWPLRWEVRDLDGALADLEALGGEVVVSSSDEAVVEVDAGGLATAVGVGSATITVEYERAEATCEVTVQDDGSMSVTVISGVDGLPVAGARVMVDGVKHVADENGVASFKVTPAEAVSVTAYTDSSSDLIQATFIGVTPRDVVLPLRPGFADDRGDAVIAGDVDLTGTVPSGGGEKGEGLVTVGLAVPTLQDGPLFFNAEHLMAETRAVEILGLEVMVPSNLYIEEFVEDYEVQVDAGAVGVWAMAGPVPWADLFEGFETTADLLSFMVPNLDVFRFSYTDGLLADEEQPQQADVRPDAELNRVLEVVMAPLPEGFVGTEDAMLLALHGEGESGPAVVGISQGKESVMMSVADGAAFGLTGVEQVLAYAEVGGVGAGGGRVLSLGDVVDGVATIEEWQLPPTLDSFNHQDMLFALSTDSAAHASRLHIRSNSGARRDVYLPAGAHEMAMPTDGPSIGYGNTVWDLISIEADEGTWESMLVDGGLAPEELESSAVSVGRVERRFTF